MGRQGRPQNPVGGTGPAADLARHLRLLREHANLTLRELAALSGLSTATLSVAEAGRLLPSWNVCSAFARACGGDLDDWRGRWEDASRLLRTPPAARIPGTADSARDRLSRKGGLGGPPPLPVTADSAADFMDCLLRVKIWAGDPPVRVLAARADVPPSTLQDFMRRSRATLPAIEMVCKFLEACGVEDQAVIAEWVYAWRRLKFTEAESTRRKRRGHLRSA